MASTTELIINEITEVFVAREYVLGISGIFVFVLGNFLSALSAS